MLASHWQINPRLISLLTGKDLESINSKPTPHMLPGKYARLINEKRNRIKLKYSKNKHTLLCHECGKKGTYDLGFVLIDDHNFQKYRQELDRGNSLVDIAQYIQPTGYFRCQHCNSAGKWSEASFALSFAVTGGLLRDHKSNFAFGKYVLFDGKVPQWATDAEEHLLDKLQQADDIAFVWNRLGNMYYSGGRPELAAAAYEQSLKLDARQIESHLSLGQLLMDCGEWEQASYHFRRMLLYARTYTHLKAEVMRDLLANGLQGAMLIHLQSDKRIPFLPDENEISELGEGSEDQARPRDAIDLHLVEMDLHTEDMTSFYPLAEMYMGKSRSKIPRRKRLLGLPKTTANHKKAKNKRKKKKHRKKK